MYVLYMYVQFIFILSTEPNQLPHIHVYNIHVCMIPHAYSARQDASFLCRTTVHAVRVKGRKTPIPLPRKKQSVGSTPTHQTPPYSLDHLDQPPKSKPVPAPRPTTATNIAKFPESNTSSDPSISNVGSSNIICTLPDVDGECDASSGSQSSHSNNLNGQPTYLNLNPLDEKEEEDHNMDIGVAKDSSEVTNLGSHERYYNLLPANTNVEGESQPNGGTESRETYYNLPPANEDSGSSRGTGTASHEFSPTSEESSGIASHERYYNLPPTSLMAGSSSDITTEAGQRPTLDEFLGRILQPHRETTSKMSKEKVSQESRFQTTESESLGERVETNGDSTLNCSNVCQSPEYYNLPPALGGREEGGEGEQEAVDDMLSFSEREDRTEWLKESNRDRENRKEGNNGNVELQNDVEDNTFDIPTYLKILPSNPRRPVGSVETMEYRSEWLKKAGENGKRGDDENVETQIVEDNVSDKPAYLKILPSSPYHPNDPAQAPTQTSKSKLTTSSSIGNANTAPSEKTEQQPSVTSLPDGHGSLSSESGSPLWGTRQPWSRPNSLVSPLAREGRHSGENSPFLPSVLSNSKKRQKSLGSHQIPRKQRGSRKGHRRPSDNDDAVFKWPGGLRGGRRRSSQNIFSSRLHWIHTGDESESEEDSDYEWAEIAEALSDTGSDYVYTKPRDIESLGLDLSGLPRSVSWSGLNQVNAMAAGPDSKDALLQSNSSISHRPPAPLPACTPGKHPDCPDGS